MNALQDNLAQFTGSETAYRVFPGAPVVITEGVKYLADEAQAYWLLNDMIILKMTRPELQNEPFQFWRLEVNQKDSTGKLVCDNGDGVLLYSNKIGFTDFPLPEIRLWFIDNTILLPSEY